MQIAQVTIPQMFASYAATSEDYTPDELPITLVGRRFLLLFEARLEAVGAQPRLAGMIATSLRIGNAAIGLLQLPYPLPEG